VISGLTNTDTGIIKWNNIEMNQIPPHLRNFGLMFQDNILFPHLNVFNNVSFGLKQLRMSSKQIEEKTLNILNMMNLTHLAKRNVLNLSGGEEQRVALARTIAPSPSLLMLDEPLGSLDRGLRDKLLIELKHILTNLNQTAIYVTHDQDEAFKIADRIAIMNNGEIKQIDHPQNIYAFPASSFVARFLGLTNVIKVHKQTIQNNTICLDNSTYIPIANQVPKHISHPCILIKTQGVQITKSGNLEGIVTKLTFQGILIDLQITMIGGLTLNFEITTPHKLPKIGEKISLQIPNDAAIWIEED
jgi:ABC-type Fe3+/spermidine/putrescine transport system ATPase subunit